VILSNYSSVGEVSEARADVVYSADQSIVSVAKRDMLNRTDQSIMSRLISHKTTALRQAAFILYSGEAEKSC